MVSTIKSSNYAFTVAIRNLRFRIYPSKKCLRRLNEQFEINRDLYNQFLQRCKEEYETNKVTLRRTQLSRLVTEFRKNDPRFTIPYSDTLRKTADQLCWAFEKFYSRVERINAGEKIHAGYPRFKKALKSIRYPEYGFSIPDSKHVILKRIGKIPIVLHRLPMGKVKEIIILRKPGGRWYLIFTVQIPDSDWVGGNGQAVGVDVGINSYATLSDGTKIENPEYFRKSEKKIIKLQRKMARKERGSHNRRKAKRLLAIESEHIKNQRSDFIHKLSNSLVSNYGTIVVESLTVSNMIKNHKLAKSISDASWSRFIEHLQYKAESAGKEVLIAPRMEPTTKKCSRCGSTQNIPLSERTYTCHSCGLKLDRDINAAINILRSRAGDARIHACGEVTNTSTIR